MIVTPTRLGAFLGLGLAGLAATAGMANSAANPVQCGVVATTDGGKLVLEGAVLSPVALDGSYRFSIRSTGNGGSSNISQGGYFTAAANEATPLGRVMINAGASYDVMLDVTAAGQQLDCDSDFASLR